MFVGIVGTFAAGKTTAVQHLGEQSFLTVSLSDILREKATERGLKLDRDTLYSLGNEVRQKFGPTVLMEEAINRAQGKDCVFDSIRTIAEVERLKLEEQVLIISVDAPQEVRFQRAMQRQAQEQRDENAHSIERFIENELREESSDRARQQILEVMSRADALVKNVESKERFLQQVLELVTSFKPNNLSS